MAVRPRVLRCADMSPVQRTCVRKLSGLLEKRRRDRVPIERRRRDVSRSVMLQNVVRDAASERFVQVRTNVRPDCSGSVSWSAHAVSSNFGSRRSRRTFVGQRLGDVHQRMATKMPDLKSAYRPGICQ